jgi:hypothetical protein
MRIRSLAFTALTAALVTGCSGGAGSNAVPAAPRAVPTATSSPFPSSTASPGLPLASTASALREGLGMPLSGGALLFPDGDSSSGGLGAPVAGIACIPGMAIHYHIHAHLSIINGGSQLYLPQAIGLWKPSPATGTFPNTYANVGTCAYNLHMHDHSGIIHIESATVPSQPYTLGEFFAIWGQPLSTSQVATLTGPVRIYITGTARDVGGIQQPTSTPQVWMGPLSAIPLVAHQEITIVVGQTALPFPRYLWPPGL